MTNISAFAQHVTEDEVGQFKDTVDIRDPKGFAAQLESFVQARVEAATRSVTSEAVASALAEKAAALRSHKRWTPGATDIQRGRAVMLEAFNHPSNLPLQEFADLAHKSRQQIYKDIDSGRLMALSVGPRGQKLPDWQLDELKRQLTEAVRECTPPGDDWAIYRALSQPLEGLGGQAPVDAVTPATFRQTVDAVLNVLGVQGAAARFS